MQIHRLSARRGLPQGEGDSLPAQTGGADENRQRRVARPGIVRFQVKVTMLSRRTKLEQERPIVLRRKCLFRSSATGDDSGKT